MLKYINLYNLALYYSMLALEESLRIIYIVHYPSFMDKVKEILRSEFNSLKVNLNNFNTINCNYN